MTLLPVGVPGSKYELLFELGKGGMSRVYLAMIRGPAGFTKLVVIKRLHEDLASEPEFRSMFQEEARLSARLNHPNIVQVNEVGFDGVHYDMEMEYLEGQSLDTIVRRANAEGGLPLPIHLRILSDALAGLHYAHEFKDIEGRPLQLVHRDVSPHNVFVTYDGHVKILDFGIAKAADSVQHTRTGVLKGKCAYMAPEQLLALPFDRRIDVYAMGVMLWQAAANRKLWKEMSDIEIFQKVVSTDIPRPSTVKEDVPPELEAICMKALARKVDERYQSADELRIAINEYLGASSRRVAERELGQYVSKMFEKERHQVRSAIETQMRKEHRTSQPTVPVIPGIPSLPAMTGSGSMEVAGKDADTGEPLRPSRKGPVVFGLVAALALGGGGFYLLHSRSAPAPAPSNVAAEHPVTPPPSASSVTAAASAAPSASAAAAIEYFDLTLTGVPADARFSVDDLHLTSNPAKQRFLRDGKVHRIVATAPGYAPFEQSVLFAAPAGSVQAVLTKLPPSGSYRRPKQPAESADTQAPTPPPAPPPPTVPATSANPKTKGGPSIDQDNPYGK